MIALTKSGGRNIPKRLHPLYLLTSQFWVTFLIMQVDVLLVANLRMLTTAFLTKELLLCTLVISPKHRRLSIRYQMVSVVRTADWTFYKPSISPTIPCLLVLLVHLLTQVRFLLLRFQSQIPTDDVWASLPIVYVRHSRPMLSWTRLFVDGRWPPFWMTVVRNRMEILKERQAFTAIQRTASMVFHWELRSF